MCKKTLPYKSKNASSGRVAASERKGVCSSWTTSTKVLAQLIHDDVTALAEVLLARCGLSHEWKTKLSNKVWGQCWEIVLLSDTPSGPPATQLCYLDVLSIWMTLLLQDIPYYPTPFFHPSGIFLTFSFFLWEGGITIIREGCIPAGKVMQIFESVKNRAV